MKLGRGAILAILATLLAVVGLTATFAYSRKPSELAQRDALRNLGVLVSMDGTGEHISSVNCSILGRDTSPRDALNIIKTLRSLTSLDLSRTGVTDADLASIKNINSLASLSLSETGIGDGAIQHFANLDNLIALHLSGTKLTDAGLSNLTSLGSLKILDLSGTKVAGEFVPLAEMPHLEWLVLSRLELQPGALLSLQGAPAMRRLSLKEAKFVADEVAVLRTSHPGILIDL